MEKKFSEITFIQFITASTLILFLVSEFLSDGEKYKIITYAFFLTIFYALLKLVIPGAIISDRRQKRKEKDNHTLLNIGLEIINTLLIGFLSHLFFTLLTYPNKILSIYFTQIVLIIYIIFLVENKNFNKTLKEINSNFDFLLSAITLYLFFLLIHKFNLVSFFEYFTLTYFMFQMMDLFISIIPMLLLLTILRVSMNFISFSNNKVKYLKKEIIKTRKGFLFAIFIYLQVIFMVSVFLFFPAFNSNTDIIVTYEDNCTIVKEYLMNEKQKVFTYTVGVPIKDNYQNISLKVDGVLKKDDSYSTIRLTELDSKEYIQYFDYIAFKEDKFDYYIFKFFNKEYYLIDQLSVEVIEKTC
jgi:hypothetical protein